MTDYTVNQFDPNNFTGAANKAYEILSSWCGPAVAVAFMRYYGNNISPDQALSAAQHFGYLRGQGMPGPQAEYQLLQSFGIPVNFSPNLDVNSLINTVQNGGIGAISTPGHYFTVEGYNPNTGQFDTGWSGRAYKSGSQFLTLDQIRNLGGNPNGVFTLQRGPSVGSANTFFNGDASPQPNYGGADLNNPYVQMAIQAAQAAGIPDDLFVRQIQQESGFNPSAQSGAGASGIAQIVPSAHPGVNVWNPNASLNYAANLMASFLKQYNGDQRLALAAYNAGPGAVAKYGGVPPFAETMSYVDKILSGGSGAYTGRGMFSNPTTNSTLQPVQSPSQSAFSQISLGPEDFYRAQDIQDTLFGDPYSFNISVPQVQNRLPIQLS